MGISEKVLAAVNKNDLAVQGNISKWNMDQLLGRITDWVFIIAGIVAFFFLIYSGFIYLTAGGNPEAAKKGQQGILNSIIGIAIIALAYGIVTAVSGFFVT